MEKRSKEFLQASFYLSRFSEKKEDGKYPGPPAKLNVDQWKQAYLMFYERLNGGRSILAFENSLKNTRDEFDSHLPDSGRTGWRGKNRKPKSLSEEAEVVFNESKDKTESEIWNQIREYADLDIKQYKQIVDDLIGIQESEAEYKKGKTEGGRKVFTSSRFERSLSAKNQAIKIHGVKCKGCGFDFEEVYGEWGAGFIEVHHLQSLASNEGKEVETDPETDLAVLCANCHRMVHRKKEVTLTIEELKSKMKKH
ncbi:HNH endonuclease [Neolewinella persica]|uniref:HNH endonuclease n=1 Tax=Neolewinella persica TaxID=70998 RepID=UPI0003738CF0|nr:HNH endonuclease [Neolewinella persica]